MVQNSKRHTPVWLLALGGAVLAALAGSLVYAATIALINLSRIGV